MLKAAIFDLDGTLAYTFEDIRTSIDEMRHAYGLPPISDEDMIRIVNFVARDFAAQGLGGEKRSEEEINKALDIYTAAYAKHYLDKTTIYEGLPEVLKALKKDGIKLAVYSNKMDAYVKKIMIHLYGEGIFDVLMGPDGIKPKPDPMGALIIAEKWGLSPSEIAFVGDSVLDIKTGLAAGMTSIGVSWGYTKKELLKEAGAEYIVDTRPELLALLKKLSGKQIGLKAEQKVCNNISDIA